MGGGEPDAHASTYYWQIRGARRVTWAAVICAQLPGTRHPFTPKHQGLLPEPGIHSVKRGHQCWGDRFGTSRSVLGVIFQWQQIIEHNLCFGKAVCLGIILGQAALAHRLAAVTNSNVSEDIGGQ